MRAITIDAYQTQPHLQEMPRPQPGEGEILIRLHAAGVALDTGLTRAGSGARSRALVFHGPVSSSRPVRRQRFRPGDAFGQFMPQRVHHWALS